MGCLGKRTEMRTAGLVTVFALACVGTMLVSSRGSAQPSYPRLANLYLRGAVDPNAFDALAAWDLLVLDPAWSQDDLAQLRARNPDVQLLLYVNPYSVVWPSDTDDAWSRANSAYADAHTLWWYDRDGQPASDWPGTRMVNITALGAPGPEGTWREFLTARIADLVATRPDVDGIMLDNFWRRLSWNQSRLQLDSDCNPAHNPGGCDGVADGDSALDARWNQALATFAANLRARLDALEAQRTRPLLLIGNGASDYHAWLQGAVHEFFPSGWTQVDYGNPYGYNWNFEMFDPNGGYLAAPFSATPQRADIMNAAFVGTTAQPLRTTEFERHKRFTLVSALLGDGYYSLDADADGGHGSLWWEPEYDHAGRGRGYLGQPRTAATRRVVTRGDEIMQNGTFASDLQAWIWHPTGADGSIEVDTRVYRSAPGAARLHVADLAAADGELKAWQNDLVLQQDVSYTLALWARADRELEVIVELYASECPSNRCLRAQRLRVTETWTRHVATFVAPADARASLNVFLRELGSVWLDDVSLREGTGDVFQREFDHGIVLLNYSNEPQTLTLDGAFARLDIPGSAVFDGAVVEEETVPPWDGRILLRSASPRPSAPQGSLHPNEPNPFNPTTRIRFDLTRAQHVRLAVFDLRGRLVRVLHDGPLPAGNGHSVAWMGTDRGGRPARTGVYVYRLVGPHVRLSRKMTLLR